jgi:LacI family transcriptional regulator
MADRIRPNGTTLRQVAEAAGVSVSAVSKVLHGRGTNIRVSEATADVIRAAAERLRYHPNALAQSLRMSKTQTIGLIWEHMGSIADGPLYYVHLLDGVSQTLFANHYRLTILPELPDANPVRALGDGRLDGVIWCKLPSSPAIEEDLSHTPLKVVALNAAPPQTPDLYPSISCDNVGGARLVVDHLAELGHKHILFVVDKGWETTPDAYARYQGFREGLAAHGLPFDERSVVQWSVEAPRIREWLVTNPPHTAIFGWHEGIAGSVLKGLQKEGVRVPEDVSVVGFDSTMFCESLKPRLTAVRQPVFEMASRAAQLLIDLVEGKPVDRRAIIYPCALDVRESTSSPADHGPRLLKEEDVSNATKS